MISDYSFNNISWLLQNPISNFASIPLTNIVGLNSYDDRLCLRTKG